MMRWSVSTAPCKCALSKSRLPGLEYAFNPYRGCTHGCLYCYVPDIMRSPSLSSTWGRSAAVKEEILRKLKEELRRLKPGVVGVSTVTDPYQPLEGSLMITRQAISILSEMSFPVSVQTKSALVARDADIIRGGDVEVGITITSSGESFRARFEPGASPIADRARALNELSSMGIKTWIFYGPIIPGSNALPADIEFIVRLAGDAGSRVLYDGLNVKPMMRRRMLTVFTEGEMERITKFNFNAFYDTFESECRAGGVKCRHAFA